MKILSLQNIPTKPTFNLFLRKQYVFSAHLLINTFKITKNAKSQIHHIA